MESEAMCQTEVVTTKVREMAVQSELGDVHSSGREGGVRCVAVVTAKRGKERHTGGDEGLALTCHLTHHPRGHTFEG
jgi:hypothetical protein